MTTRPPPRFPRFSYFTLHQYIPANERARWPAELPILVDLADINLTRARTPAEVEYRALRCDAYVPIGLGAALAYLCVRQTEPPDLARYTLATVGGFSQPERRIAQAIPVLAAAVREGRITVATISLTIHASPDALYDALDAAVPGLYLRPEVAP